MHVGVWKIEWKLNILSILGVGIQTCQQVFILCESEGICFSCELLYIDINLWIFEYM